MNKEIEKLALSDILNAVVSFNKEVVVEKVKAAINSGISIDEILNKGLIEAMDVVGTRFSNEDIFVPKMLQSAKAMQAGHHVAGRTLIY